MDDFENTTSIANQLLDEVPTLAALTIAIVGMILVAANLKRKGEGFGQSASRAFAVAIFLPTIIILASETDFASEAVAAILGSLAGYIFSKTEAEKPGNTAESTK